MSEAKNLPRHVPRAFHTMRQNWQYIERTCESCGQRFLKPSTWRKTSKCPTCSIFNDEYITIARHISRTYVELNGWPDVCSECGKDDEPLQIHHIIPLSKGGGPGPHNIAILCYDCHRRKHARELEMPWS